MQLTDHPHGCYRFASGIAPYSAGVTAMPGYEIVRAVLAAPLPVREGFRRIEQILTERGRPRAALCAMELRSPAPFTFDGFVQFNAGYRAILEEWGLLVGGQNPVARTNIAPAVHPPAEPSLYAFSFTVPANAPSGMPTFIVAGAGDLRDQAELTPAAIVRGGETSAAAMAVKAATVMDVMDERLAAVGASWAQATAVNVYTVQPLHSLLTGLILDRIGPAAHRGVTWHYSRPPIAGLEFEMDVRGVRQEEVVA